MYFLPKIHKSIKQPPSRPIVNGKDSVTARVGQHIDFFPSASGHQDECVFERYQADQ